LRIRQASNRGSAASIRIDDPNPDIEFVEIDQIAPAGKYEIAVQSDKLQINGRNANDSGFETVVVVQRLAAGGNLGFGQRASLAEAEVSSQSLMLPPPRLSIPLGVAFCT
jgi:hypothetical protein